MEKIAQIEIGQMVGRSILQEYQRAKLKTGSAWKIEKSEELFT